MTTFSVIKARYLELVAQSNELFAKVSNSAHEKRITYETEVNGLDFSIMKLSSLIKQNPSVHSECSAGIDLQAIKDKVAVINQLIFENPTEEP